MRAYTLAPTGRFVPRDAAMPRPPASQRPVEARRLAGPLSNEQKARLCMLARQAWEQPGVGHVALDDFRHEQVSKATGKPGLTACTQDDWNLLLAHFLSLVGATDAAFHAAVRHGTEPARIARHKLAQALGRAGLPESYAAAICRRQYKCALADATERQLWQLVYTINNRGTSRRRGKN